ncbi:ankyrin repeat domain-containing protein [Thermodesulfobacteriota bacterium]
MKNRRYHIILIFTLSVILLTVPFASRSFSQEKETPAKESKEDMGGHILGFSYRGDVRRIRIYIKAGATLNERDTTNKTPLINAGLYGHTEVAKMLIEAGADINAQEDNGKTALIMAAWWNNPKVAELLINANADLSLKDAAGMTALDRAKKKNNKPIIKMLEEAMARPE